MSGTDAEWVVGGVLIECEQPDRSNVKAKTPLGADRQKWVHHSVISTPA